MKRPIVLVGFMASGKSTLAPQLSKYLGYSQRDSDAELAEAKGCGIADWIRKESIQSFRVAEQKWFKNSLKTGKPQVIASGGGSFTQRGIRSLCREYASTVWLDLSFDLLKERLNGDLSRPMWPTDPLAQRILYARRCAVYTLADIRIQPTEIGAEIGQFWRIIKDRMPRHH